MYVHVGVITCTRSLATSVFECNFCRNSCLVTCPLVQLVNPHCLLQSVYTPLFAEHQLLCISKPPLELCTVITQYPAVVTFSTTLQYCYLCVQWKVYCMYIL